MQVMHTTIVVSVFCQAKIATINGFTHTNYDNSLFAKDPTKVPSIKTVLTHQSINTVEIFA